MSSLARARGAGSARAEDDAARIRDTEAARPGVVGLAIGDAGAEVVSVRGAVVPGGAGVAGGGGGVGDVGGRPAGAEEHGESTDIREHLIIDRSR
jgi:hypothetical protein